MVVAGLTGGIASGKSTVAGMLAAMGAIVLDADLMARRAVVKGSRGWEKVVEVFGRGILTGDGRIDRAKLGDLVFAEPDKRVLLEKIIHPLVRKQMEQEVKKIGRRDPQAVVVQDVPLLFEAGMDRGLDEIIVVWVPESLQLERLMERDGLTVSGARARIRSQMPLEEKRRLATMVIDNSGSLEETRRQTERVYRRLAAEARAGGRRCRKLPAGRLRNGS